MCHLLFSLFFTIAASPQTYPLSLHDALPIYGGRINTVDSQEYAGAVELNHYVADKPVIFESSENGKTGSGTVQDRKSTRLNSSHLGISYAVFCLKKKKKTQQTQRHEHTHTTQ